MKQQEIIEGNKLIAQFIGLTIITDEISLFDTNYKSLAKYHKSWDDLMPIVKKIREIINVELNIDSFEEIREQKLTLNPYDYDIEQVFEAVVEFIKWYNENKNK